MEATPATNNDTTVVNGSSVTNGGNANHSTTTATSNRSASASATAPTANEPSPAYSPMDFPLNSDEPTPENSRSGSPTLFTTFKESLIEKIKTRIESKDKFFSLEFFPPRTKSGAINLMSRLERMGCGHPLFVDITWHPAGNPMGESETSSTMIAHTALNYVGLETMLHMTCLNTTKGRQAWLSNYFLSLKGTLIRRRRHFLLDKVQESRHQKYPCSPRRCSCPRQSPRW